MAVQEPFSLHISVNHPQSCSVTYHVLATSPASSEIRTTETGVYVSLDTSRRDAHYFNVTATDECGHVVRDVYNVFVLPGGEIPGHVEYKMAETIKRDCKGGLIYCAWPALEAEILVPLRVQQ